MCFASCLHHGIISRGLGGGRSPPNLQNIDKDLSSSATFDRLAFESCFIYGIAGGVGRHMQNMVENQNELVSCMQL